MSWETGHAFAPQSYVVTRADLVRYAGASGDFNPIHWSDRVASSVGLSGVIAHGMYTLALASRAVTTWVGDPATAESFGARFTKPVPVPDVGGACSFARRAPRARASRQAEHGADRVHGVEWTRPRRRKRRSCGDSRSRARACRSREAVSRVDPCAGCRTDAGRAVRRSRASRVPLREPRPEGERHGLDDSPSCTTRAE